MYQEYLELKHSYLVPYKKEDHHLQKENVSTVD